MNGVPFDVKVYMKAVRSYLSGKKTVEEVVQKAGISQSVFYNKLREYRTTGRIGRPKARDSRFPRSANSGEGEEQERRGNRWDNSCPEPQSYDAVV